MEISVTKSKVITPEDDIIILKPDGTIAMTLGKVTDHNIQELTLLEQFSKLDITGEKEQLKQLIHTCGHVTNYQKKDLTL